MWRLELTVIYLAIGAGAFALAYAGLLTVRILKSDAGSEQVQAIGRAIQEGANAFLSREYRLLAGFVVVMFIILAVFIDFDVLDKVPGDRESIPKTAISYIVGAIGSALAGFIGMSIAVRANTRTTVQAQHGLNPALRIAFNSGAVMGVTVVGIGLIGITVIYWIFQDPIIIAGFGFGASSHSSLRQGRRRHYTPRQPTWGQTWLERSSRASQKTIRETPRP